MKNFVVDWFMVFLFIKQAIKIFIIRGNVMKKYSAEMFEIKERFVINTSFNYIPKDGCDALSPAGACL